MKILASIALLLLPFSCFAATVIEMTPRTTNNIVFIESLEPNAQETAAESFFTQYYPQSRVIKASALTADSLATTGVIWMHCDREGLEQGVDNLLKTYVGDDSTTIAAFKALIKTYSITGGNIYVSSQAVQLLYGIDRMNANYPLTFYGNSGNSKDLSETWYVSSNITDSNHANDNYHAIYGHIADDYQFEEVPVEQEGEGHFPILGPENGKTLKVDDNNCIWGGDTEGDINAFRRDNNCQVLGTWGQNSGTINIYGIVEYLPDGEGTLDGAASFGTADQPWEGNTIANGLACCEWAPEGTNAHLVNFKKLTFNTLNYLTKLHTDWVASGIDDVEAADSSSAPVEYFNLQGQRVLEPASGLYIRRQGNKTTKILL